MIATIYNTKIKRMCQIIESDRYVCGIWLPKKLRLFLLSQLNRSLNKIINPNFERESLKSAFYTQSLRIRYNILEILLQSLKLKETEQAKYLFKKYMHQAYTPAKLGLIESRLEKIRSQFELLLDGKDSPKKDFDFSAYCLRLELILETDVFNKYLFQLKALQEEAIQIITKQKKHGV